MEVVKLDWYSEWIFCLAYERREVANLVFSQVYTLRNIYT